MGRIIVMIFRLMPLEIALVLLGFIGYKMLENRKSNTIAKEVLIKYFLFTNVVAGACLLLVTLYAVVDHNMAVIELAGCMAAICALTAGIALICKIGFLKNRPGYRWKRVDFSNLFGHKNS